MKSDPWLETSAAFVGKGFVGDISLSLLERRSIAMSSLSRTGIVSVLLSSKVMDGVTGGATKSATEATSPTTTLPVEVSVEYVSIESADSPTSSIAGVHLTVMRKHAMNAVVAMAVTETLRHASPTCTGPGSSSKDCGCDRTKNCRFDKAGEVVKSRREAALGTAMSS